MLKSFSIAGSIERSKKVKTQSKDVHIAVESFIPQATVIHLENLGFTEDQIREAYTRYKFRSTEEAIDLIMIDPETNLYKHFFAKGYNDRCLICGDVLNKHQMNQLNKRSSNDTERNLLLSSNRQTLQIKHPKIDQTVIDGFDNAETCYICFDRTVDRSLKYNCRHSFCKQCLITYFELKINCAEVKKIKCLHGGCPYVYNEMFVKELVPQETFSKFIKFVNRLKRQEDA